MTERFRFEVTTDSGDVTAFARALGLIGSSEQARAVPLTYPARWLARDDVRGWIAEAVGGDALPVHAMQDFEYRTPIEIGRAYTVEVACSREEANPTRLTISAEISEKGFPVCSARATILRVLRARGHA